MTIVKNMSLRARLVATMALMLVLLVGTLAFLVNRNVQNSLVHHLSAEREAGIRALAYTLRGSYPDLTRVADADGQTLQVVWPDMPDTLPVDDVDAALAISGLDPSVFHFNADTREFTRIATSIREDSGNRAVARPLNPGPAYDALIGGEVYSGSTLVGRTMYESLYVPVFDADGTITGAFSVLRPLAIVTAATRQNTLETLGVAAIVLTVMLAIAFFVTQRILAPLTDVTRSIVNLSEGKLDEDIQHLDRGDEFGKISNNILMLQQSMQKADELQITDEERSRIAIAKKQEQDIVVTALTDGLSRLGNLDLTQHIENTPYAPFPQDYEGLRTSYNILVDNLTESVEAIREVADEVNGDARDMAASSIDLSRRTESQAATLEESAAALEQLSASVQSTASYAGDAEATTKENRTAAKRTGEIVEAAITAMASIEESSQKITQIISVIDDIAFQTNLLALNAGVEAARAGDAGRGFAVVASEVRALAQHSSASAKEIKSLIASSSDHVENGSKLVRKAGKSLNDITERVDRVAGLVSDIAVSAKEQSIGVTEINSGVRDLDAATQRNAAMAEEASAASEGLTNAADRLAAHLGRFQMATTPAQPNWAAAATATRGPEKFEPANASDIFAFSASAPRRAQLAAHPQVNVFKDF